MGLGTVDYIIFIFSVLLSAIVSFYYRFTGGKQKTNKEYLLGGKNQSIIPVAFSLVANFASSISILGYTSEAYNFGTHFFGINIAYLISTPVAAVFYLPVIVKNDTVSVYEYFEKRFGKLTRLLSSLAFTIQMILYMGIVHYAPALAIEAVAQIPQLWSILVIGFICICYSAVGGMKAVICNDVIQTLLMFAAVLAIIIVNVIDAGSIKNIYDVAVENNRIQFNNFDPDPTVRHSWWTVVIGGFFTHITVYSINQAQVQRYVSMSSYERAAYALLMSCPILILFMSLLCVAGLCMVYYFHNCDPIKAGNIKLSDQIVPWYVMTRFNSIPGLTGLFVAGIFSASLSTVSAAVNSLAAVSLEDYVKPLYKIIKKQELVVNDAGLSKWLAFFYGFVCLGVAMTLRNYESLIQSCLVVFGMVGGPMFGLFTVGVFFPHVNECGAVVGFILGLTCSFGLGFGGPKPKATPLPTSIMGCNNTLDNFHTFMKTSNNSSIITSSNIVESSDFLYIFKISYLYYIVIGFLVTVLVSIFISCLYDGSNKQVDADLFTPLVAKCVRNYRLNEEALCMNDIHKMEEEFQKY